MDSIRKQVTILSPPCICGERARHNRHLLHNKPHSPRKIPVPTKHLTQISMAYN